MGLTQTRWKEKAMGEGCMWKERELRLLDHLLSDWSLTHTHTHVGTERNTSCGSDVHFRVNKVASALLQERKQD